MLTQIRHIQKGTLIVVTAIIVIAFGFLYTDAPMSGLGSQKCVFKVYGKCYRAKEALKLRKTTQLASQLGMTEYVIDMFGRNRLDGDDTELMMNMIIFRKEAEELGISPTFEEIQKEIPNLRAFQQDPTLNADNLKNFLARSGFTLGDFQDLVKDFIAWKQVRALLTAGVDPVPSEVDQLYTERYQRYDVTVVDINRKDFEDKVDISDEAIKTYYDENAANLMSEPKRGFVGVHFIPGELPADATNEQKATAMQNFKITVRDVYGELSKNPAEFEKIIKGKQNSVTTDEIKVETLEPFAISDTPEFLKGKEDIIRELFSGLLGEGEVSKAFRQPDGSYYAFKATEVIDAQPLKLEEAKEQIITALKNSGSDQLASDAAAEAKAKILDAVKAGKSIEEAAKAAGLKTRKIPNFSRSEPPSEIDDASSIVLAASGVSEGEVGDPRPKPNGEGYLLAYVDKIVLYKNESQDFQKTTLTTNLERNTAAGLFDAWFHSRQREADTARVSRALAPEEETPENS